jgi:hypothetical protein
VDFYDVANVRVFDSEVFVGKQVPHAHDRRPPHAGLALAAALAEPAHRLADDHKVV